MFLYGILHTFILDPIYGMTIGFGEPLLSMIRGADYRIGWASNPRSWVFIIFVDIVTISHMNTKPRLVGKGPEEYWSYEANDHED